MLIKDVVKKFKEFGCEIQSEDNIIKIFNLIEQELIFDYFPLCYREEWKHYPKVYYQEFSKRPIRIIDCENKTYQLHSKYIITKNRKPLGYVEYDYLPDEKNHIDDLTEYDDSFLYIYVYGMISEYYLQEGKFEESYIWDKKYKDAIQEKYNLYKSKKVRRNL